MAARTRRHTAIEGDLIEMGPFERLELWANLTRRQQDALKRAVTAVELMSVIWSKMSADQKAQMSEDAQIGYLVRQLTSAGYGYV